jgi:hypothetical protein
VSWLVPPLIAASGQLGPGCQQQLARPGCRQTHHQEILRQWYVEASEFTAASWRYLKVSQQEFNKLKLLLFSIVP